MALKVDNLTVMARHLLLIDKISLDLKNGSSLSVIGPSGSGKTTLVNVILGLIDGYQVFGTITWDGQIIQNRDLCLMPLSKRNFGYIPQNVALWPHLSVGGCLTLCKKFISSNEREIDQWIDELIVACGLKELLHALPSRLSGGEKQKFALARALSVRPKLLVLDEPFSALDVVAKFGLMELLKGLQKRLSFSLIFISHDINEALGLGQSILVLEKGKTIWYGERTMVTKKIFSGQWNPLDCGGFNHAGASLYSI